MAEVACIMRRCSCKGDETRGMTFAMIKNHMWYKIIRLLGKTGALSGEFTEHYHADHLLSGFMPRGCETCRTFLTTRRRTSRR
jgi:hypothetical protein